MSLLRRTSLLVPMLVLITCAPEQRSPSAPAQPLFRDASADAGLTFHQFNGATGAYYMPENIGSGVAVFDYDGDGDLDVLFVQGDFLEAGQTLASASFPPAADWRPGTRLFRNELIPSGRLRFTDVTEPAGIAYHGMGMGAAVGDYDNDGHADFLVTGFRGSALYHNNGDGTFTDATRDAGIADSGWSTSASFVDYDRDGRLDLFIAHYVEYSLKVRQCDAPGAAVEYCAPSNFRRAASLLFHNEGHGRFRDVSVASMIASRRGPGFGVLAADFDGDGWPDLYVANDGAASHLWMNKGDGTFREAAVASGVAFDVHGAPQAGMGVSAEDFDNDGDEDLVKTNLNQQGANLYRNEGNAMFTDVGASVGLNATLPFTGFGTGFFDYDNDGWLDLVVVNGAVFMVESQRGEPFPYRQPNQLFRNERGKVFRDVSASAGEDFSRPAVGRSVAFGDLNGDGCVDLVIGNNNGPARLLLNRCDTKAHWLDVRLEGVKVNREGIGAHVTVERRGEPPLRRRVHRDGSFLSSSDVRVHFGLGHAEAVTRLLVEWPDGTTETFPLPGIDRVVVLKQGTGR